MGIFNDIINWFEDLGKKEVSKQDEQELINQLAAMNVKENQRLEDIVKNYGAGHRPQDKEFEYLDEYVPVSEDILRKESEDKYSQIYNDEVDKANSNYQQKLESLEKKEKDYIDNASDKSDYYTEKYKDKTNQFKSTANKNGIADSSILTSKADDLEDERDKYISDVMSALKEKLNITGDSKNSILEDKNNKISSLDENFSKNVEDMLNQLLEEENKKVKEVESANKKTAKEEQEYKDYQKKVVQDKEDEMRNMQKEMFEKEADGEYSEIRQKEFDKRYELAKEFYSKYTRKSAIAAIEGNESLKKFLGSKYARLIWDIKNG